MVLAQVDREVGDPAGAWGRIGIEDYKSLGYVSTEHHESVARQMETIFEVDSSNTVEMTWERWRARHPLAKVSEAVLSPFRPLL